LNKDLTDITVVLDRSGSMASCQADAQGGLNTFIKLQQEQPGDALFTLVQFDHEYEFVHNGVPIKDVPAYTLEPRGSTALLDAVGRAINEVGARLTALPEDDRPGLVVMAILTDGGENASKEFSREQVRAMIEKQTKEFNWQFTFLGANQDAFASAASIGISAASALNYTTANSKATFDNLSSNTARMRNAVGAGGTATSSYTTAERWASVKP
jgi:hypothetical protein